MFVAICLPSDRLRTPLCPGARKWWWSPESQDLVRLRAPSWWCSTWLPSTKHRPTSSRSRFSRPPRYSRASAMPRLSATTTPPASENSSKCTSKSKFFKWIQRARTFLNYHRFNLKKRKTPFVSTILTLLGSGYWELNEFNSEL